MTEPRGYSIAFARDMIPAMMAPYSAALPPIYEKYGGAYIAIGGPGRGVDWLWGDWNDRLIMIGEFANREAVGEFWWGPEYRAASKLRKGAVTVDVAQVGGAGAPPAAGLQSFLLVVWPGDGAWRPPETTAGVTLIAADAAQVTTLEGDLSGLSLTLLGFPDRASLDDAWQQAADPLRNSNARVGAVNRAAAQTT